MTKTEYRLWDIIDDIDTLDDACKSNDAVFRERVREKVKERNLYFVSDGFKLFRVTPEGVDLEPEEEE